MRSRFLIAAAAVLPLLLFLASTAQTPNSADQNTSAAWAAAYNQAATEYNQAVVAKDWPRAVTAARQIVALKASSENLRVLASAQANSGALEDSLATYDRALAAAEQEKPAEGQPDAAWKDVKSKIYLGKGNAFLKLHRNADATDAYNHAAELASNPGQAYFNICAVLYNLGDMQNAPAACRKSVQVDPTRADAWFVLGSLLYANSTTMDASHKFVISAECRQALEKYLELAPDGPHATDVKAMLQFAAQ